MDPFVFLIVSSLLLLLTTIVTILQYERMRKIKDEYTEAKNVVSDIVVSFNKQLQKQEEQVDKVGYSLEALSKINQDMSIKIESLDKQVIDLTSDINERTNPQKALNTDIKTLKKRIDDLTKVQEQIKKNTQEISDANLEAAIPIKRERALAPLTETELRILEIIASEGEKTAPAIKDLIKQTREHTARLVKKLYEKGYLERNTTRTPYAYQVKEEMLKFLKKPEAETNT